MQVFEGERSQRSCLIPWPLSVENLTCMSNALLETAVKPQGNPDSWLMMLQMWSVASSISIASAEAIKLVREAAGSQVVNMKADRKNLMSSLRKVERRSSS